jgi:predicted PurR-regulated permease PerM
MKRVNQDTAGNIFRRNWRLIAFVVGLIIVFWLVYILRSVLLPFICGLVLAYLLYPIVSWLERKLPVKSRWLTARRASLIAGLFILILVVVGVLAFYIVTGVASSFSVLIKNAPQYFSEGLQTLRGWLESFQRWLPPELQQGGTSFQDVGTILGNAVRNAFGKGISYVAGTFGLILGFVALPVFLFYVLKDWEKLSSGFYSAFSPQMSRHVRGVVGVINNVLGRWIRAQLVLSATVAVLCFIGLAALGITLAPALAVILVLLPLGAYIAGLWGIILVVPLTATAVEIYKYVRDSLKADEIQQPAEQ